MLTVSEAAKTVGISRGGLWKAIKRGKLSATKDSKGCFTIDLAELLRAYPQVDRQMDKEGGDSKQPSIDKETGNRHSDELVVSLREQIALLKFQAQALRDDVLHEREQADHWRRQATMLLEHKPEPPKAEQPTRSRLYEKLFGRKLPNNRRSRINCPVSPRC
jgi:excisionase family DNA binding protein